MLSRKQDYKIHDLMKIEAIKHTNNNQLHMKYLLLLALCYYGFTLAQPNTEIYLMDIHIEDSIKLKNVKNSSTNEGYDSQPFFLNNNEVIYAGSRNGQTEIIQFAQRKTTVFNTPTTGGEYSPQPIPNTKQLSAVRLDTNGYQRLYRYSKTTSTELVKDAVVAYYTWADPNTVVAADIVDSNLHLSIHKIKEGTTEDLEINVGRSFHKIPQTNLVSFIDKSQKQWFVKSLDPKTKDIKTIAPLVEGSEDICWLPDGSLLLAKGNTIFKYDTDSKRWKVFHSFLDDNLRNISRIASSPDGNRLAIVSEVSPEGIVQKQLEAYNKRNIDSFMETMSPQVSLYNFPNDTIARGFETVKKRYNDFFKSSPDLNSTLKNRIVYNNKVIDHEYITAKGKSYELIAIYTITSGKISNIHILRNSEVEDDVAGVVDNQLKAYNQGDTQAFMDTYSDAIQLFDYPNKLSTKGKEKMAEIYSSLFKRVPDLHCTISNRIVLGEYVIDLEDLSGQGSKWRGIAIYSVKEGKIDKVTFL